MSFKKRMALSLATTILLVGTINPIFANDIENNIEEYDSMAIEEQLIEMEEPELELETYTKLEETKTAKKKRVGGYSQNDVRVISCLSQDEIKQLLPARMKELAPTLYQIEHSEKPINALFLISVIRLESWNGSSYLYRVKNNVGGIKGAYLTTDKNGKTRKTYGYLGFSDKKQSLLYMQDFLSKGYIYTGNTKKDRISVSKIGSKYCVGGNWAAKVNRIAKDTMYRINELN
ncbi:glucosaminidase domain-containing protein [Peptostreptococcus faecalis]|uniref:glucosaminidase domain-containing protein n=1 Tax=Peptostreptococcus faecalis TaxID=2045015 RepID=UPI000C7A86AE|nr:glucosaminidase domain-containing protein [Peptostreptococcus faecalis]